jgi:septal ring factor EnvC (AmiA/AmiB activator)
VQYKKMYEGLKEENDKLRAENGDLLCGLHAHADTLRADNERLKARLDRAQQELARQRRLIDGGAAAAQMPGNEVSPSAGAAANGVKDLEGVAEDQNLFEVRIEKAELDVGAEVGTFVTVDFYDHLTQVHRLYQCT